MALSFRNALATGHRFLFDGSVPTVLFEKGIFINRSFDEANLATVHYTCPGTGHGQTTFKITTARNFTLETQGILNGAPFDEQYEARRTGVCAPGAPVLR